MGEPHSCSQINLKISNMTTLNYQGVRWLVNQGDTTAFVHKSPSEGLVYFSNPIDLALFFGADNDEYRLDRLFKYPDVEALIRTEFLNELRPLEGVEDECYNTLVKRFEGASLRVITWRVGEDEYYMLYI